MNTSAVAAAPGRILVVDDEDELLYAYVRALTASGYVVECACDGAAALEQLSRQHFDLVVSDISMPGLDGLQLLRRVRERDLNLPVVLATGLPTFETAESAIELGVLRYLPKPVDLVQLRAIADRAVQMYRLAQLKREALEYLDHAGGGWMGDRAGLEVRFDSALRTLWMAYQPIVRWSRRQVFAYEALMRPTEPTLGRPEILLDAAERLGRLHELGRTLRASVAATMAGTDPAPSVFVNLHSRDLADESLLDPQSPLSRLAPQVVLEITERARVDDIPDLRRRIHDLRALGFRIAIDDLGAGYAGLTSFAQLEPDLVKIDMGLVRDIDKETTKQRLVRAIASLCAEMDIAVVCEGVETPQERDALVALGCDLFQGFLFARPAAPFPHAGY